MQKSTLSDRQADHSIQQWLDILHDMRLDELQIGHALKRDFFTTWLKKADYKLSGFNAWIARFATANSPSQPTDPADVLILRGGKSDRELLNYMGLGTALSDQTVGVVLPPKYLYRHPLGVAQNFGARLHYGSIIRGNLSKLKMFSHRVDEIQQVFALPDSFRTWFWIEVERALWVYQGALAILERAHPTVLISAGDNLPTGYVFHTAARHLNIQSIAIQHGFIGQEWLHFPVWADKVCVWGDVEKQFYVSKGIPADKIAVTGNPRGLNSIAVADREATRTRLGCPPDQRLFVWFTTPHGGQWTAKFIQWLSQAVSSVPNAKHVLKLHPKENKSDYIGKIPAHVDVYNSTELDLQSAFVAADGILHDYSSIGAEATRCNQNVFCTEINSPYPPYYRQLIGDQQVVESSNDLVSLLTHVKPPQLRLQSTSCLFLGGEEATAAITSEIRSLLGLEQPV